MRHFLCTDKRLVKSKQNFIQFKNIVVSVHKEILNNHIKFTAVGGVCQVFCVSF